MNFEPSKPVFNPIDWTAIVHFGQFQAGFLARTAHELRSPLSSLMSLHQLILNDLCDSPAEERECLKEAYQAATRLLKMLEVVTQVSKLEAGLSPLRIENINLQILLDELRILTQLQAANRNLHLKIEAIPDCPEASKIYTDFRVLQNWRTTRLARNLFAGGFGCKTIVLKGLKLKGLQNNRHLARS